MAAAGTARDEKTLALLHELAAIDAQLRDDHEVPALLHALDGRFVRPAPGGDLLRNAEVLPTGRNLHGFDPFRIPSAFAIQDGTRQAERLLSRHVADGHAFPESIALVLWGTDNLKTEGGPIAQALALMGARPRFDTLRPPGGRDADPAGRIAASARRCRDHAVRHLPRPACRCRSSCWPRPRSWPPRRTSRVDRNFVRKHALQYQQVHGCDLETASLRVFGNADGAYGSNVNHLLENSRWNDEDELAETYTRRKSFAFGRSRPARARRPRCCRPCFPASNWPTRTSIPSSSASPPSTRISTRLAASAARCTRAKGPAGTAAPVYIGDQTCGEGTVRTLGEQVALETRTRMLNPKWYEGMLQHGYEGVRQIEVHVTNTMGWSATTGQVAPWVYQQLSETFVLDPAMRERLAALNPTASAKVANRLLEAHERNYWSPDDKMLDALRRAGEELEDRLEGVIEGRLAA